MSSISGVVWCLAYILGLLMTAIPYGSAIVLFCGLICAIVLPRMKPKRTIAKIWIVAGLIGFAAGFYLQVRTPQPSAIDISQFVPKERQEVTVSGIVETLPKLTRSGNSQIWLNVSAIKEQKADGRLYVTLSKVNGQDLYPGQAIAIQGNLYKPKPKMNPGGFDFQKYLAQEGSFAGLKGTAIRLLDTNQKLKWDWWMIQREIVRSQAKQFGEAEGALISAMVIGGRVVDIPFDIKNEFGKVGLSHALAASGFQVSLILGVLLTLTKRLPGAVRFGIGAIGLIVFMGLTGMQPAVFRAVVMGFAVLFGILFERRVKPLNSLLIAAIILLIVNPLWIWNLGFQFSFLATLGLLVTVPAIAKRLDWLPTLIVPAIAVPIAALIWTLPLQLFAFGMVSPYCIPANVAATIFISWISIGGIVNAGLNLISPAIATFTTPLLYYPTLALIHSVKFVCQLPGNSIAVGTISLILMLVLYGLVCTPWMLPRFQRQWWVFLLIGINLVFVPVWYVRSNLLQVTALSVGQTPVMVIQDHGRVGLINAGDVNAVRFTVLPFLQKEGVNQIDWAVAVSPSDGWATLLEEMSIRSLYDFSSKRTSAVSLEAIQQLTARKGKHLPITARQTIKTGAIEIQFLSTEPTILQFGIGQQRWLWLKDVPNVSQQQALGSNLTGSEILWWSGRRLHPKLLERMQPKIAIASSRTVHAETLKQLQLRQIQTYETEVNGGLQWSKNQGFRTTLDEDESEGAFL
ncbi:ComEC/Rec2 family competence protein [Leptolyngbya sp. NIES-2104]|uniref:ComEC/Rec2 family competence protein n=1 Tax=Leptolyngbya sp. NIES-2104 TaxID=1552121 RepID=UPI00073F1200|nr:ComEC/Rec2 family competence protein [Leptolyngbya sp. NIES-2104]